MDEAILGERLFTDGAVRRVFIDGDGRQFVFDDDEKVIGFWLDPEMSEPDLEIIVVQH